MFLNQVVLGPPPPRAPKIFQGGHSENCINGEGRGSLRHKRGGITKGMGLGGAQEGRQEATIRERLRNGGLQEHLTQSRCKEASESSSHTESWAPPEGPKNLPSAPR